MSNYDALNIAELLEENDRLESQGGPSDFLDNFVRMPEKEGFVIVRLLPPVSGKKLWCATRTHRINNKSIHCPRELVRSAKNGNQYWQDVDAKKPCVICKYYNDLWKKSEDESGEAAKALQDQARKIKPVERYYYNCIARHQIGKNGEVEKNVGPKILSIGKTLHQRIVRALGGNKKTEEAPLGGSIGAILDFKDGRDFKIIKTISRSGKDSFPNYDDSKFLDPTPIGEKDQIETWLASLHDLNALRVLKSLDEMKTELKRHLGLIPNDDTSFDLSEFQKPSDTSTSIEDKVRQEVQKSSPAAEETHAEPAGEDKPLAESDFMQQLRDL